MGYKVNCYIKAEDGIQIECDDIQDFYKFDKHRIDKKEKNHIITLHIKSVDCNMIYMDEYNVGIWEWCIVDNDKFLNYYQPLCFYNSLAECFN